MKKQNKVICMLIMAFMCLMVSIPVSAAPKISKSKATLIKGQTLQLKVTGTKSKANWSSSKKSVATVSAKGKVTAKKTGVATITAKVGKKKYTCKLTVIVPKLSVSNLKLNIGDRKKINVSGITDGISWSSSNKRVAIVTSKGNVIAKGCGLCQIYATVNGNKLSCSVNVGIADPECFPSRKLKIGDVTFDSFEAKFVSFQLYKDYSKNIDRGNMSYFFPYKYHIKMKGSSTPNRKITIRFCMLTDGKFPDMPGNNFIQTAADSKGNFLVDQDINFSTYGEMIYIASADVWNAW